MKKSIVSKLVHTLCDLQGLEMLMNVGLKRNSASDKIDLLAACGGGNINKYTSPVEALLKDRWPTGNFFICDDSVRFNLPTGTGGVAIYDSTLLVQQIEEWVKGKKLDGHHRPWATGYWLPEALCGDLATAEILYDTRNIGMRIKKLVVPYSQFLSHSIVQLCVNEIKQKIQILKDLPENEDSIEFGLCLADITAAMVRLAFARSSRYFRGFKSLINQKKLLRSEDLPIYNLALRLSKRDNTHFAWHEIRLL